MLFINYIGNLMIYLKFLFLTMFICGYISAFDLEQHSILEQSPILVMIDPAGHAKNVGRRLVESYERGETFKFAEKLKDALSEKYGVRSVLTRYPGEEIIELQNASFANRLQVDFYLSLNIYREESVKPKIFVYHLVYDPMVDLARRIIDNLLFIPIHQAHFKNIHRTKFLCNHMRSILFKPDYQKKFDFYGPYGIPFKPLIGVTAPAIGIELGISEEDKWQNLVEPLVESLKFLRDTDFTNWGSVY